MGNLLDIPGTVCEGGPEFFETLLTGSTGTRVERIVSHGQSTPEGEWYDQHEDEWVMVVEGSARIVFACGTERSLARGDHLLLPRRVRHRVTYTSTPCIWLAVFGDLC